jgi:hypothetical protein
VTVVLRDPTPAEVLILRALADEWHNRAGLYHVEDIFHLAAHRTGVDVDRVLRVKERWSLTFQEMLRERGAAPMEVAA